VSVLVVDTSAIVAILGQEAGAEWLSEQLSSAERSIAAAPTVVELAIVLEARAPAAVGIARRALRDAGVEVVPFDDDLADRAVEAWRRFGRGRHPAALNFGDCFTYSLADRTHQPILCVGDDFAQTDVRVLRPPG
jgi:ribonuclease VapC